MTFRELERIIKEDGWKYKNTVDSHHHYVHDTKLGKDVPLIIVKSALKQAGLK